MNFSRTAPIALLSAALLAGCGQETQRKLDTLAHVDSVRVDSLANVRKDLLDEVMSSTQFVNDINTELAKARALASKSKPTLETAAESEKVNDQRKEIVARISHLVARLDSVQTRLASTRARASKLSQQDSGLVAKVAEYEKSIADMQAEAQKERADFQGQIDRQTTQIAALNSQVDTLSHVRVALVDTVNQLTTEKNTAYYVVGTKDELIKKGILVAEGSKRFLIAGSRTVSPARELDPAKFTKIDRLADRTITLPAGQYQILSRQNPAYAAPKVQKDGKIAGALTINEPEEFWKASPFLIIVRS
ncbi:MAG TPA: hypothetical protein VGM67_13720 [Gemmatimonadaceae bacterium]